MNSISNGLEARLRIIDDRHLEANRGGRLLELLPFYKLESRDGQKGTERFWFRWQKSKQIYFEYHETRALSWP